MRVTGWNLCGAERGKDARAAEAACFGILSRDSAKGLGPRVISRIYQKK